MKKSFTLSSVGLFFLGILMVSPTFAQWSIESFDAVYKIRPDATIHVTETITADFSKTPNKHGIIRNIPFQNQDIDGNWYNVPLENFKVTKRNFQITTNERNKSLRIGHPNRLVAPKETYVIEYDVKGAIVYFDTWDELYWNVTGSNWDVPIKFVSAKIILPNGQTLSKSKCFTGRKGSTAENCKTDNFSNTFISQTSFRPGEGFTIVAGFKKGLVEKITYRTEVEKDPYRIFFLILNALLLLLPLAIGFWAWNHWRKYGRDPKVFGTVIPRYSAPEGMSPAQVGAVADEVVHPQDITAMIVDLAGRGFLSIEKSTTKKLIFSSTDHILKKIKSADGTLTPAESFLIESIFGLKSETKLSELKNKFYKNVDSVADKIFDTLVTDGYFPKSPRAVRKKYQGISTIFFVIAFGVVYLNVLTSIPFVILGGLGLLFAKSMPVKTRKGAEANLHIKGYKEFLKTAEKDRLKWADRQNIFESNLAYAVALNVVESWTEVFGEAISVPSWYKGSDSPVRFSHDFSSFTRSLSNTLTSSPKSTGGGGGSFSSGFSGGSSGGGGGGGGGSSW